MKYHLGEIDSDKGQNRDESGVATWELLRLIERLDIFVPKLEEFSENAHVDQGTLSKILNLKQEYVRLLVADRILTSLGVPELIHELTVIPGDAKSDAIQMAIYEKLDENDELQATEAEIEARADELRDLRLMMLSGAVEASMPPKTVLHS